MTTTDEDKELVRSFWEEASCGEAYAVGASLAEQMAAQARTRYELEPFIPGFARFEEGAGRDVLEIGVGMGADHAEWARHEPARLACIDLTARGIEWTARRLDTLGLTSELLVGDAERLPFPDASFDIVYSWGVLHHSPDTERAFAEVARVLRPGGTARIMIYHRRAIVGYLLWARYGLAAGRPTRSLTEIYDAHLESPGTKAYSIDQARELVRGFERSRYRIELSGGDLLEGEAGQRHTGGLLTLARRVWPRRLIRRCFPDHGLFLLIEATKG
jgi:SAM-dependent methyltransferase